MTPRHDICLRDSEVPVRANTFEVEDNVVIMRNDNATYIIPLAAIEIIYVNDEAPYIVNGVIQ